jgi:hypothetical protein
VCAEVSLAVHELDWSPRYPLMEFERTSRSADCAYARITANHATIMEKGALED